MLSTESVRNLQRKLPSTGRAIFSFPLSVRSRKIDVVFEFQKYAHFYANVFIIIVFLSWNQNYLPKRRKHWKRLKS